ncbi:MAG: tripartite tricarboxylate transporter substrate binding protein [Desulfatiglandaceae bacterium]
MGNERFKKLGIFVIGLFSLAFLLTPLAFAADIPKPEDYPEQKIEWNLWYGPGGGTDVFSRTIGIPARKMLPAPLVIINIPGAAGANGMIYTMDQPADGYTITSIGNDLPINDVLQRAKYEGKPLGIEDFEPIIRCQYDTATIQVSTAKSKSKGTPFKDIQEFIEYAKAHPGEVSIGGTGSAGFDEVAVNVFMQEAGIECNYIPYDSAGKMHAQVLGGHIDAMFEEFGPTVSLLEQGSLKALIVFKEDRVQKEPFADIPAAPELGYDVTLGRWRGIGCKVGTPPERIEYLHQVFKEAMEASTYKTMEKSRLLDLRPGYMGPAELKEAIKKEKEVFSKVLEELGYVK